MEDANMTSTGQPSPPIPAAPSERPAGPTRLLRTGCRCLLVFILAGLGCAGFSLWRDIQRTNEVIRIITHAGASVETQPWGNREYLPAIGKVPDWVPRRIISVRAGWQDRCIEWLPLLEDQTSLRFLSLEHCQLTDSHLKHLENLHQLQSLELMNSEITGSGFRYLYGLHELEEVLILSCPGLTDEAYLHLSRLPNIRMLVVPVDMEKLTDEGLRHLGRMPALRDIEGSIGFCEVTDAGLMHLAKCRSLRAVDILVDGENITVEGARRLQAAMPNCEIGIDGD